MAARQRRKPEKQAAPALAPAASFNWRRHGRFIAALWLWALIPYSNSFRTGFPLDNAPIILNDARVHAASAQNIDLIWSKDYWYGSHTTNLYRPLTTMTYLVNYAVLGNGAHAGMYHAVNFALHAVNMALVYLLALALLGEAAPACALAAIWGVHPVLTESVTNIVGRADLLAGFGVLAGLLCHIQAGRAAGRRKAAWLAALALAGAIGMFSKESAIVVLGAMAAYDLAFGGWRRRISGYAAAGLLVLCYLYARAQVMAGMPANFIPFLDNPIAGAGFWTARLTAIGVIGRYLWLLVWPASLSADYSYNQVPLGGWWVAMSVAICAGAAVLAWRFRRRRPELFFLTVFFFAALAPTANVFFPIGTVMAERFLYLPSIAIAGLVVLAIFAVPRRPRFTVAAVAIVCLPLAGRTFARNFDWFDGRSLWSAAAKSAPASFKVHDVLAGLLLAAKPPELDGAVAEADRDLAILRPLPDELQSSEPYATAGACYRQKGDSLTAAAEKALWYHKAVETLETGERIDRAIRQRVGALNAGQRVRSGWPPLYLELGRAWLRLDEPRHALEALEYGRSLSVTPEFFEEISHAYQALGDRRRAAIALMEALVYDSSWSGFASLLVDLYQRSEPQSCALRNTGGGASLDMACPLVHDELCTAARNVELLEAGRGERDRAGLTASSAVRELGCPAAP